MTGLAIAASLAATASAAAPYVLTTDVESALEQKGLAISGTHHRVHYARCSGQGYVGGTALSFGVRNNTYRIFLCVVVVANSPLGEIAVHTLNGSRTKFTFSWKTVF